MSAKAKKQNANKRILGGSRGKPKMCYFFIPGWGPILVNVNFVDKVRHFKVGSLAFRTDDGLIYAYHKIKSKNGYKFQVLNKKGLENE